MPRPPKNTVGWGTPCQSSKGQDGQKTHSSSWSGSGYPSLWQDGSQKGKESQGNWVKFLLTLSLPAFAYILYFVSLGVMCCKTRFYIRLKAQIRLIPKCIQLKVMGVNVFEESYPLTRPRWPEFLWLVHCRHYRNRQACGWWYSCGLPWQPHHGPALPGVFGLAWPGLEHMHVWTQRSTHTHTQPEHTHKHKR